MTSSQEQRDLSSDWDEAEEQPGGFAAQALDFLVVVLQHKLLLAFAPLAAGLVALGIAFVIPPTFTARTMFLPPQQQQSAAASAIASLGTLGSLAGAAAGIRSPGEQFVALLQSVTVSDRIIAAFDLMKVYDMEYRVQARKALERNVRIGFGKKDGLITIEVDDESPARAAEMANRYVYELRQLTQTLALTEAQQRRAFFEGHLKAVRDRLEQVQASLQESGFSQDALKAEPKAVAENYARLRAEVTAAEVRLTALRRNLVDTAPEVQQALSVQQSLRVQLSKLELATEPRSDSDYIGRYREFKYQETLFDLFARQYELARVDESREGPLIQVVDEATLPERKSKPKRALVAITASLTTLAVLLVGIFGLRALHKLEQDPEAESRLVALRQAWRGRS
jgi:uncharacterized protein involved in exopolysaccharide biosynthesis